MGKLPKPETLRKYWERILHKMKVVILAGGLGTRLSEETDLKPKPMVEIGDRPIIWHIMKTYSHYGLNDFIICCGYKASHIKEYFYNYYMNENDLQINMADNHVTFKPKITENWNITLVDTGLHTQTGGRLLKIRDYLGQNNDFCLTYGDGLADINIGKLITFHKQHGKLCTVTATRPPARFGSLVFGADGNSVERFQEKIDGDGAWISGGYFVLNSSVINRVIGSETVWEADPLESLARDKELIAFKHSGFWQPMDTLREKWMLNRLWNSGEAPWKVWKS